MFLVPGLQPWNAMPWRLPPPARIHGRQEPPEQCVPRLQPQNKNSIPIAGVQSILQFVPRCLSRSGPDDWRHGWCVHAIDS